MTTCRHREMEDAAYTLSIIINQHNIGHTYIGGFALNLLGSDRETSDIDVLIDVDCPSLIDTYVTPILCGADSRFAVDNYKLYFGSSRIPLELLTCSILNLPRRLSIITAGVPLPILRPGVLILTKIKRASQYIGSTRPQSVFKYNADVRDIVYLLHWLQAHDMKIDFENYDASDPERLYRVIRKLHDHWVATGQFDIVRMLGAAIQERDWHIVFSGDDVSEITGRMPFLGM
ncbi:hypothetical protein QYS62_005219 [Fusarium acuminatum]|uniref:Nucleotidyl transferase n=1 Tax=Fusarium acuminatum TaxID=5515 RepID=A0ABZ2WUG5_9HYPO